MKGKGAIEFEEKKVMIENIKLNSSDENLRSLTDTYVLLSS